MIAHDNKLLFCLVAGAFEADGNVYCIYIAEYIVNICVLKVSNKM